MTETLDKALSYLEHGWSIIPVGRDKSPLIKWTEYQKRIPTEEEVQKWFTLFPEANIGIVTGEVSGLVVVDVEKGGDRKGLEPTLIANTGGGGWHYYYKHPGFIVRNSARKIRELVDIRGDGGYAVAPPSVHSSGNQYEWSPLSEDLSEMPDWLLKELQKEDNKKLNWQEFKNEVHLEGERNQSAASYVGGLLYKFEPNKWGAVVWPKFQRWNQEKNIPPLSEDELRGVFESISGRELATKEENSPSNSSTKTRKNKEAEVVDKIKQMAKLFHNQYKEPHMQVVVGGHKEIIPIGHKYSKFRYFVDYIYYKALGRSMSDNKMKEVASTLAAMAMHEGEECKLFNRMARVSPDEIWLDMCDKDWRAININKSGWSIVDNPPILFRKFEHSTPYAEPIPGGNIKLIEGYTNLANREYLILLYTFLVATLLSNIQVPCLLVHGQQGSSKTTLLKIIRDILDPSVTDVLDFSNNKMELIQMLDHNRVSFFDNLTYIPHNISDLLCRTITGFSASKKKLYTDDDDFLRSIRNVVGLNGIVNVVGRPDLLERSIIIECAPIKMSNRRPENDIWDEFRIDSPKIFGGLLDLTVKVLNKLPEIEKTNLRRMADYMLVGEATAQCMGMKAGEFRRIYELNIAEANQSGIEQEKLAQTVVMWMDEIKNGSWTGTATKLYEKLTSFAIGKKIISDEKFKSFGWPKDSSRLSQKLKYIIPLLSAYDIEVLYSRDGRQRNIKIIKTSVSDVDDTKKEDILPTKN